MRQACIIFRLAQYSVICYTFFGAKRFVGSLQLPLGIRAYIGINS